MSSENWLSQVAERAIAELRSIPKKDRSPAVRLVLRAYQR